MKKVSIVLPTYNRAKVLTRAIDSVLAQTYQDWELIVVNDASTDETEELLRRYEAKDHRIRHITFEKNRGVVAARNAGIQDSVFEWIAFQDSDDVWLPEKLELQIRSIEEKDKENPNESVDAIYSDFEYYLNGEFLGISPDQNVNEEVKNGKIQLPLLVRNLVDCPTLVVRRELLDQVGYFDPSYRCLEDWELALRLAAAGNFLHVPKALVQAYSTDSGVSSNLEYYFDARCKLLAKYRNICDRAGILEDVARDIMNRAMDTGMMEKIADDLGAILEQPEIKVTIIMPVHNSMRYLGEALSSIDLQTMDKKNIQVIAVDDASTDASREFLQSFASQFEGEIKLIFREENGRQGAARNDALSYVRGKYMIFLDSDDVLTKDTCEVLYQLAEQNHLDLIQCAHVNFIDAEHTEKVEAGELMGLLDLSDPELKKEFLVRQIVNTGHWNKFYRSRLVAETGSTFAEGVMYEEPKFVYPILLEVKRVAVVDFVTHYVRIHADSTMQSNWGEENLLMQHPMVQRDLYHWLMERREHYAPFWDEIEYYYFLTYYVETILFSVREGKEIRPDSYKDLVETMQTELPNLKQNPYIKSNEVLKKLVSEMTEENAKDQETLEAYMKSLAEKF